MKDLDIQSKVLEEIKNLAMKSMLKGKKPVASETVVEISGEVEPEDESEVEDLLEDSGEMHECPECGHKY